MKLLTMLKGFRGKTIEDVVGLCKDLGIDLKLQPIPASAAPAAEQLQAIAQAALDQGAKFFKIDWKSEGDEAVAFVVLRGKGVAHGEGNSGAGSLRDRAGVHNPVAEQSA